MDKVAIIGLGLIGGSLALELKKHSWASIYGVDTNQVHLKKALDLGLIVEAASIEIVGEVDTVIIKHVRPPSITRHPRGWDGARSHERKLRSYRVESAWYRDWSDRCDECCRVPTCYALAANASARSASGPPRSCRS